MRASLLAAAVLIAGCSTPEHTEPAPVPPRPRQEPVLVLEAPEGSGLRRERPAMLRVISFAEGAPIRGAKVTGPGATDLSDPDGFCELPRDGGKPRAWTVTKHGYVPAAVRGIGRGEVIVLRRGRPLEFRVLDTFGRPVPGARVALVGWLNRVPTGARPDREPNFELELAAAGSGGEVRLSAVEGVEHLRVSAARHLTMELPISALPAGPGGLVARMRQSPGGDFRPQSPREPAGLEILVRDASTLAPVPGLPLRLQSYEPDGALFAARTGRDGVAVVRCPAGKYGCLPGGPFALYGFERANVAASTEPARFLIRATRNPTVAFEIAGLPEGATLVCAVDGSQREVEAGRPVAVRAGLELALTAQGAGSDNVWRLPALHPDEEHRTVQLAWARHTVTPPALPKARGYEAGAARGSVLVDVRDPKGRFLSGHVSVDGRWDGKGSRVAFEQVTPGAHRVVIWAQGREVLVKPIEVKAGAATRLLGRLRPLDD